MDGTIIRVTKSLSGREFQDPQAKKHLMTTTQSQAMEQIGDLLEIKQQPLEVELLDFGWTPHYEDEELVRGDYYYKVYVGPSKRFEDNREEVSG